MPATSRTSHARLLENLKTAMEAQDAAKAASHYAEDALFLDATARDGGKIRGREELQAAFRQMFAGPGCRFEVTSLFGCGGWAAGEWIWSGQKPDGSRFVLPGASIIQIRGGKIVRETIYYDSRASP